MMGSRPRRYGHGRWPRKQVYAIVASYREAGRSSEWVAAKLGVGPAMVHQLYADLEWMETTEYLAAAEAAGGDPDEAA